MQTKNSLTMLKVILMKPIKDMLCNRLLQKKKNRPLLNLSLYDNALACYINIPSPIHAPHNTKREANIGDWLMMYVQHIFTTFYTLVMLILAITSYIPRCPSSNQLTYHVIYAPVLRQVIETVYIRVHIGIYKLSMIQITLIRITFQGMDS